MMHRTVQRDKIMAEKCMLAVARSIKIPCTLEKTDVLDAKAVSVAKKYFCTSKIGHSIYVGEPFLYKRSVDARDKNAINLIYSVAVKIAPDVSKKTLSQIAKLKNVDIVDSFTPSFLSVKKTNTPPVVVGFGPGGMFCALALARAGLCPTVIERGDDIDTRTRKVNEYWQSGKLCEESNVQFGEGGAGAFSDGKLLTRISDNLCSFVMHELVKHGAPGEITYLAKPHVGTDNLKAVVKSIREEIIALGGSVRFGTRLDNINCTSSGRVKSIQLSDGSCLECEALFLCIGHSARDTVKMLRINEVDVEPKPFSVGVRIEHLQEDIDKSLYGKFAGAPVLSKAQYTLSRKFDDRAVYSFCMCPGGVVVASASRCDEIVTNGMSYYARDGKNANSAIAVSVNPKDYGNTVEGAVEFQKNLERKAFISGGSDATAPILCLGDFLNDKCVQEPNRILPTYTGKTKLTSAKDVFPEYLINPLKDGIGMFERDIEGFSCSDAVLTFPETRTSSPVKIPRGEDFQSITNEGLYPVGEGAGYAGGITSAAVDGLKAAIKYMEKINL